MKSTENKILSLPPGAERPKSIDDYLRDVRRDVDELYKKINEALDTIERIRRS